MFCFRSGRPGYRILEEPDAILALRRRHWRLEVHARRVVGVAPEIAERRDVVVQRTGRCAEPGAVRGRYDARVPHQPHTGAAQGQCATGGRRRQWQTVSGPAGCVHIGPGPVPDPAQVHVRHGRIEGRPFRVVHQGRPEERRHHVPDDRLAGGRRAVPRAHQRHAGQRTGTGNVCRRRNRHDHSDHQPRGTRRLILCLYT